MKNNIISDWLDKHNDPDIDKKVRMKLEDMSKERHNQIIDETYGNYISYIHDIVQGEHQIYGNWYGKKEFIDKCKTDSEFSEKWGLKIGERELSLEERVRIIMDTPEYRNYTEEQWKVYINTTSAPTKLITLTYNNETLESYE